MSEEDKEPISEENEELAENAEGLAPLDAEDPEGSEVAEDAEDEFDGEEEEEVEFDLEDQVETFRAQIEEDPDNCVHHYNLGEALAELGQSEEAQESFEQALLLDKEQTFSSIIHFGIGNLY